MVHFLEQKKKSGGFSLIELLVSIAILTFITSIILANHNRFSGNLLLGDLAYEVALSVRQAQVFGLSVREFKAGLTFDTGYGVHFDAANQDSYRLFADTNRNKVFESGSDSVVEVFSVRRGFSIANFCVTLATGVERCSATGEIDSLDIAFIRPEPEAHIRADGAGTIYREARIVLRSPSGAEREVLIESTGQISIP